MFLRRPGVLAFILIAGGLLGASVASWGPLGFILFAGASWGLLGFILDAGGLGLSVDLLAADEPDLPSARPHIHNACAKQNLALVDSRVGPARLLEAVRVLHHVAQALSASVDNAIDTVQKRAAPSVEYRWVGP